MNKYYCNIICLRMLPSSLSISKFNISLQAMSYFDRLMQYQMSISFNQSKNYIKFLWFSKLQKSLKPGYYIIDDQMLFETSFWFILYYFVCLKQNSRGSRTMSFTTFYNVLTDTALCIPDLNPPNYNNRYFAEYFKLLWLFLVKLLIILLIFNTIEKVLKCFFLFIKVIFWNERSLT